MRHTKGTRELLREMLAGPRVVTARMDPTFMARPEGLEPPAYRFEACRSIQLSYGRAPRQRIASPRFSGSALYAMMSLRGASVSSNPDEQELQRAVQDLSRAWMQHDRAFIEGVLAPEWSVTQADGSILTRATVLGAFFDSVSFESNVIDDVSVML